jgi:hypothetical protein
MYTFVCCAWHSAHHGSPVQELIVVYRAEGVERIIWLGLVCLELVEQAFYG